MLIFFLLLIASSDSWALETPEEMLIAINEERTRIGLSEVVLRKDLECGARVWSKQMWRLQFCGHENPVDGTQFWDRVRLCEGEIRGGTEIIACKVPDFGHALGQWFLDEYNYKVITYPNLKTIGIGVAGDKNDLWFTMLAETPEDGNIFKLRE
jgi:uncharacterized protein YkwD